NGNGTFKIFRVHNESNPANPSELKTGLDHEKASGIKTSNGSEENENRGQYKVPIGLRRSSRDIGMSHYARPERPPQLRYTPVEQTVSPGSPVSLKCSAIGSPAPAITWNRDHQPLMPSHRINFGSFQLHGEIISHMNLSDVTQHEGGIYTCTASNSVGSVSHSARINVFGPPFVRGMNNVTVKAGDNAYLWCPAGGFPRPTVTWLREGQRLPQGHRQTVHINGTLIVRNVQISDTGKYSCVVSIQGQTETSEAFLHILKPPEIDPFTINREKEEGDRLQLSCAVSKGDLPMTINWLKDGRHMQHDPMVEIKQTSDFTKALFFKSLKEHHAGSYTCEVANAAASVNHTAVLHIKLSPRWSVEPQSGTALVGSSMVLDCGAR
ncbi:unnamed protein product, partial [Meganyctiphanes norvegica]